MTEPVLDEDALSRLVSDLDAERVGEILGLFKEETEARLERMRAAAPAPDFAAIEHEAHALKSAAGTFGAPALSEVARALEEAAEGRDAGAVRRLLPELDAAAASALAALRRFNSRVER